MNHYTVITLGWVIGQICYAAVSVYILQMNKNINYWHAWAAYGKKELGNFVIAFTALILILFIANDYLDVTITRQDLLNKQQLNLKEKIILYQRTAAVGIGAFCQHLLYIAFKKGKKEIDKVAKENEVL